MRVVVLTHGHCFDGLASAVLFTRLLSHTEGASLEFRYHGCGYGVGQRRATPELLDGDQNALLDFRFCASDNLTWYFDHHRTAFHEPADREYFDVNGAGRRYFFDADYGSCTKLIADTALTRFNLDLAELAPLTRWANKIDSASFVSPEEAVDRKNPIMRLAAVVEQHGDDAFIRKFVPELLARPVEEVAALHTIKKRYEPIRRKHDLFVKRVDTRAVRRGRVVFVDLTEAVVDTVGKFVPYALFPDAVYSVVLGLLRSGLKLSVGYNPWSGVKRDLDISAICARYGGGGHPVVGGIAFGLSEIESARATAQAISLELNGEA